MAYPSPAPVADSFYSSLSTSPLIVRCPVTRDSMKNLFSLNSAIEESVNLPERVMLDLYNDKKDIQYVVPVDSKISLVRQRQSSYENYVNFSYNLSWIFFSEEPLVMEMTPPMMPVSMPAPDSYLAFGEFDIGQWFRALNLDYHVPVNTKLFEIKENQPLAFLKFKTERPIEFVRFVNTPMISALGRDFSHSPARWGKNIPLIKRYEMAKKAGMLDIVLSEIKKNLVLP